MTNTETANYGEAAFSHGHVILLNVEFMVRNLLVGEGEGQLRYDEMTSAEQMFTELEQIVSPVDAMVLGIQLKEPVRIAQRLHGKGTDIPLIILTEPERYEQLKQALRFAPFISNDVTPWSTGKLDQLPGVLLETVRRSQKRRAYRGSIALAQKHLGNFRRERPQIRHYLDRLLDHAPIGVVNVDINGTVLDINLRAGQILNLTEREVLGTSLFDSFPPSQREALHDMIAQCVAPARQRSPEVLDVSETAGVERYVEVIASSLVDRSGQLGATVILQDVTGRVLAELERSKAEEALRVSERLYRELVQTMSEALALTDEQHRITYVNDSFCRMFGYSCKEVINRRLLDFVHEDDRAAMHECMMNPVQSSSIQRYETAWVTRDGDKIYTLTSPKRIFDPEKGYIGCLGVFTDITERKEIEQREKKQMMELAHVSRVTTMGEMSSQIAHELAQPLAAIAAHSTGCLKMLKSDSDSRKEIMESLGHIGKQASRAREIVVRLRNFVRNAEMQHAPIELNRLVRTVVHLVGVEARWHSLPVSLEMQEPLPTAMGDHVLIEQVTLNLVHNAIEAMQQAEHCEGKLTIRTSLSKAGDLQVEVIDVGPGICDEDLKRIFEPFFTTKPDGMGMGLAITRSIIHAHGGQLSARRNEQVGMTFCFTLPVESTETGHAD